MRNDIGHRSRLDPSSLASAELPLVLSSVDAPAYLLGSSESKSTSSASSATLLLIDREGFGKANSVLRKLADPGREPAPLRPRPPGALMKSAKELMDPPVPGVRGGRREPCEAPAP